jgi:hypothetical protein
MVLYWLIYSGILPLASNKFNNRAMKRLNFILFILFFIFGSALVKAQVEMNNDNQNVLSKKEVKEGWKLLFNGVSFDGWRGINKNNFPDIGWKIENGMIHKTAVKGGDIITIRKYSSFILDWEWKMVTHGGNSGIKYFVNERKGDTGGYGYGLEYQILDDMDHEMMKSGTMKPNDYHTMGALYELYPPDPDKKPNPVGQWNKSRIVCKGKNVEHWLNGKMIMKCTRGSDDFNKRIADSKFRNVEGYGLFPEGHILLQDHDSEIYFRNIKILELK